EVRPLSPRMMWADKDNGSNITYDNAKTYESLGIGRLLVGIRHLRFPRSLVLQTLRCRLARRRPR
ncbi:MAG TPA: hypothetical protein PKN70_14495, partial [Smithellaceae bacterium]|nr:hypothetical protein [Smithellaceae bacterium]